MTQGTGSSFEVFLIIILVQFLISKCSGWPDKHHVSPVKTSGSILRLPVHAGRNVGKAVKCLHTAYLNELGGGFYRVSRSVPLGNTASLFSIYSDSAVFFSEGRETSLGTLHILDGYRICKAASYSFHNQARNCKLSGNTRKSDEAMLAWIY